MLRRWSERGRRREESVGRRGRKGEKDFALGSRRGGRGRVGERVGKECGGRGTGERNDETIYEFHNE